MRKLIALAVAVLPALAFAQITNSKHDLTYTGNSVYTTGQKSYVTACSYCHQPHHSSSTRGLWIREDPTLAVYTSTNTTAGTSLPTTTARLFDSKRCLSCHDGSIAVNEIVNYPVTSAGPNLSAGTTSLIGTTTTSAGAAGAGIVNAAGSLIGGPGFLPSLEGSHPVSVPYNLSGTLPGYYQVQTTGCAAGIAACTSNGTAGGEVSLKPNTFYGTAAYTVECQSCHDPHYATSGVFLRPVGGGGLCSACHNK